MDIVARAKGLIMQPATEWQAIAAEPGDTKSLFMNYAVPMSAIPAVAGLVGGLVFSAMLPFRLPLMSLVLSSIASYVLGLVGLFVLGKIIQAVAPKFGGSGDELGAMKLAVYSPTASWLAGIFAVLPPLAVLGLLGLYSIYLFYLGVPVVTKVPADKSVVFSLVGVVCAVVLAMVVGAVGATFAHI